MKNALNKVKFKNTLSEAFDIKTGLKEGDILSQRYLI